MEIKSSSPRMTVNESEHRELAEEEGRRWISPTSRSLGDMTYKRALATSTAQYSTNGPRMELCPNEMPADGAPKHYMRAPQLATDRDIHGRDKDRLTGPTDSCT